MKRNYILTLIFIILSLVCFGLEWNAVKKTSSLLVRMQALHYTSNPEQRLDKLKRSLELNPEDGLTRLYLAGTLMAMRQYEKAQENSVEALQTYQSVTAFEQLGSIDISLGKLREARKKFSKICRLYPGNEDARFRLIALDYSLENMESARENLNFIMKHSPGNPNNYYYLGLLYMHEKRSSEAMDEFRKLLRLLSGPSTKLLFPLDDLYYRMAVIETERESYASAEDLVKKALALNQSVYYLKQLSDIYKRQGDSKKAQAVLVNGLQRHPGSEILRTALSELQKEREDQ